MSFELIPTPPFEKEVKHLAKKYPSIKKDIAALGNQLLINPAMGKSLGNNCYKIRMTITSKGAGEKRGSQSNNSYKSDKRKNFPALYLR